MDIVTTELSISGHWGQGWRYRHRAHVGMDTAVSIVTQEKVNGYRSMQLKFHENTSDIYHFV